MRLNINVDHVATLRNARGTPYPDPVEAARVCLEAGAHGITAHLREDRRHIVDDDVVRLRALLTRSTFNLECAATSEMAQIALAVLPTVVTFVPERREERTTEGGLDVVGARDKIAEYTKLLHASHVKVSLFVAPDSDQLRASKEVGADQIELHTGDYAHAAMLGLREAQRELGKLQAAAVEAKHLGLEVAAGHGLTTANVMALARLPEIEELNIGHAVIADSVFLSLAGAVRAMLDAIAAGRRA